MTPEIEKLAREGDTSDCRTEEGITISLIDTISFLLGQLSERDLTSDNVQHALKDMQVNGKWNYKNYNILFFEK